MSKIDAWADEAIRVIHYCIVCLMCIAAIFFGAPVIIFIAAIIIGLFAEHSFGYICSEFCSIYVVNGHLTTPVMATIAVLLLLAGFFVAIGGIAAIVFAVLNCVRTGRRKEVSLW